MLKNEIIKIKVRKNIIKHYEKLNYTINDDTKEILVSSLHLHKGSHAIVTVICDNCNKELKMMYKIYYVSYIRNNSKLYYCKKCKYCRIKHTNNIKYGFNNVMQVKTISEKMMKTQNELYGGVVVSNKNSMNEIIINKYGSLENYYKIIQQTKEINLLKKFGVDNIMKIKSVKEKGQKTCIDLYGKHNPMLVECFVNKSKENSVKTKRSKNLIIPEEKLTQFECYKRVIRRLLYKNKIKKYENWDGYDYYDGEYIKDYLKLNHTNKKYPTIDHIISVYFGFIEGISPYYIGRLENLCITKRGINSSKGNKTQYEFIKNKIENMKKYIKIVCLLDRSGSMDSLKSNSIEGFNSFLTEQKKVEGDATMSIILFNNEYLKLSDNENIQKVKLLNEKTYVPENTTALNDAICITLENEIDWLSTIPNEERPKRTLCVILTDGFENASKKYNSTQVKEMISDMKENFNWEFIFLGANQDAFATSDSLGISKGNTMGFMATSDGLRGVYASMSSVTTSYRTTTSDNYDDLLKNEQK